MTAGLVYSSPFVALSLQLCVWRARSPLATPSNTQFMKEGNRFSMFWFCFVCFFAHEAIKFILLLLCLNADAMTKSQIEYSRTSDKIIEICFSVVVF